MELAAAAGDREAGVIEKSYLGDPSADERAAIDQTKVDWLKAHPKPEAD